MDKKMPKGKKMVPVKMPSKPPFNKPAHLATDKHTAAPHVTPMHCP
jgi:hypothetical protein